MANHHNLENPHLAGAPAGGPYPSQHIPQNPPWHAPSRPYPANLNPDYVYGPRFVAPVNATPLYPWRIHSDALKEVIKCLTSEVDSQVVELRKETCGPNHSRVTVVFEIPNDI